MYNLPYTSLWKQALLLVFPLLQVVYLFNVRHSALRLSAGLFKLNVALPYFILFLAYSSCIYYQKA